MQKKTTVAYMLGAIAISVALLLIFSNSHNQCRFEDSCASILKRNYFSMDYVTAVELGKELTESFPNSNEIKAWYLLSASKIDFFDEKFQLESQKINNQMQTDSWAVFAHIALAINDAGNDVQILEESEKLLKREPKNLDFLWIRSEVLRLKGRRNDAISLLESRPDDLQKSPELLLVLGSSYFDIWMSNKNDEKARQLATNSFQQAATIDPSYMRARYVPAWFYSTTGDPSRAIEMIEPILAKSYAPKLHFLYWISVGRSSNMSNETKRDKIHSDISRSLSGWKNDPSTIYQASIAYADVHDDYERDKLEKLLMDEYSNNIIYERVFMAKLSRLASNKSAASIAEQKEQLLSYLNIYSKKNNPEFVGQAYIYLLNLYRIDPRATPEDLLQAAKGVVENYTGDPEYQYVFPALTLSERKLYSDYVQEIVIKGKSSLSEFVAKNLNRFENEASANSYRLRQSSQLKYASALALANEDKFDQAEAELNSAIIDYSSANTAILLANILAKKKDYITAEKTYLSSLNNTDIKNDDIEKVYIGLKELYFERNGSLHNYAKYVTKIDKKFKSVFASHVRTYMKDKPEFFEPIRLMTSKGNLIDTKELKGKNVILYFWASHCPFCAKSMHDIAALTEIIGEKPDAKLLNINLDLDSRKADIFLKGLNLNLDYAFPEKGDNLRSFDKIPLMIALNRNGEVVYRREGANPNLVNETVALLELIEKDNLSKIAAK